VAGEKDVDMSKQPLVSVVIPTYNRAELLRNALESIFSQEGINEYFRIEVIVADDASTDHTSEIVRRYTGVRYLKASANAGAAAARNMGIKASLGKYVAFLDSDDVWLPHKLRVQVPVLEARASVGVVYGQGYSDGDGFTDLLWPDARWGLSGRVFEAFLSQPTDDVFNISTVLVRREAFDKAGYFDESLKTMEHHDMMLRLAFHYSFEYISGPVSRGRLSKNGLFMTSIAEGVYERDYGTVIEKAFAFLPPTPESAQLRRKTQRQFFSVITEVHWQYGFATRLHAFVMSTLRQHSWMLNEPPMLLNVRRLAEVHANDSRAPVTAIRALCRDLKTAVGRAGLMARMRVRRLLADVFAEAAIILLKKGSFRGSGTLLLGSVLRNPIPLAARVLHMAICRFAVCARLMRSALREMRQAFGHRFRFERSGHQ
jgi:glycosyltransferase involved in cell wall biosynthesis